MGFRQGEAGQEDGTKAKTKTKEPGTEREREREVRYPYGGKEGK